MTEDNKPYYEMTLAEYELTSHSQAVPRWSILALSPEQYTIFTLSRFCADHLRALAFVWGVSQTGNKTVLAEQIIRRQRLRARLSQETEESLSRKSRADLKAISQEAGVYHPWLNRKEMARQVVEWHRAARSHARRAVAKARHELLVVKAARAGLAVPEENLKRYGLDRRGNLEPTIFGMPLSHVLHAAPQAVEYARVQSKEEFLAWIKSHPPEASTLILIGPGILGDGGVGFRRAVQRAFTEPQIPPLFASIVDVFWEHPDEQKK